MDRKRYNPAFLALSSTALLLGAELSLLTACNSRPRTISNQQLQQQAAQATEKAKRQSKEILQDARTAAADAEQKVNAVTDGVRQGLNGGGPAAGSRIDLNRASHQDLTQLPGISQDKANEIIRHRPYSSAHELVDRGILSEAQFAAIASKVKVE